jgi:hypothetical protein
MGVFMDDRLTLSGRIGAVLRDESVNLWDDLDAILAT